MDEYNPLNYSIEPEEEPNGSEYNPFDHISQPEKPKKEKKNRNGLKLIVLVAVVAVLGSIGGSLLTGFIGDLKGDHVTEEAAPAPVQTTAESPVAPGSAGEIKLYNVEPKTAAMLMAIVADKLGKPLNELRFISIKEVE